MSVALIFANQDRIGNARIAGRCAAARAGQRRAGSRAEGEFHPAVEQWRKIYRARGIAGIIGPTDRPTPIAVGVIEELIARTSPRRIVDDPGSAPWPNPAAQRQHWQDMTRLSTRARTDLMLRLFGREPEAAEAA